MAQAAIPIAATVFSVAGQVQQGRAAKKAADSEALQYAENARRARQEGQTRAEEIQRQSARLMSDLSAGQAASGFSASDAAATRQVAEIAGVGKYNELAALYESEMDAQGLTRAGQAAKTRGKYARRSAYLGAASTAIGGMGSLKGMFGGKPPPSANYGPLGGAPYRISNPFNIGVTT